MNDEVHFVSYDPEEMWDAALDAYGDAGGSALYPGDEKEMLLRGVQNILEMYLAGVDTALRMATLTYAVGDYLNLIGESRGCYRLVETAATGKVRISFKATGRSGTLPIGSILTENGNTFWELAEDVYQTGYVQEAEAKIFCQTGGAVGNGLAAGTHLRFVDNFASVEKVKLVEATGEGRDEEGDDAYRQRIRTYGLASVTTGVATQYEAAAKGVSSDILDARAEQTGAGRVTIYLLLADETDAVEMKKAARAACAGRESRALTDLVEVEEAKALTYTLNVQYKLAEDVTTDVKQNIAAEIVSYQEWQDNSIGRAFNPDKLLSAIYAAGATRVVIAPESKFNGGTCAYTEIPSTSRCKGTITTGVMA